MRGLPLSEAGAGSLWRLRSPAPAPLEAGLVLSNSFPSGHATVAAAVGAGALAVSPGRLRWLIAPLGAAYAAVIGPANLVAWHRMSGTVGGVLLVSR